MSGKPTRPTDEQPAAAPKPKQQSQDGGSAEDAESFANIEPSGAQSFANIDPNSK